MAEDGKKRLDFEQVRKETLIMQNYLAEVYRKRREELGLTKAEVAARLGCPISVITKSEKSFSIGLTDMFSIGAGVYGLDVHSLLDEADVYAKEKVKSDERFGQITSAEDATLEESHEILSEIDKLTEEDQKIVSRKQFSITATED